MVRWSRSWPEGSGNPLKPTSAWAKQERPPANSADRSRQFLTVFRPFSCRGPVEHRVCQRRFQAPEPPWDYARSGPNLGPGTAQRAQPQAAPASRASHPRVCWTSRPALGLVRAAKRPRYGLGAINSRVVSRRRPGFGCRPGLMGLRDSYSLPAALLHPKGGRFRCALRAAGFRRGKHGGELVGRLLAGHVRMIDGACGRGTRCGTRRRRGGRRSRVLGWLGGPLAARFWLGHSTGAARGDARSFGCGDRTRCGDFLEASGRCRKHGLIACSRRVGNHRRIRQARARRGGGLGLLPRGFIGSFIAGV